jgi:hypothetical protein
VSTVSQDQSHPLTFAEAEQLPPYELARLWGSQPWPVRVSSEVATERGIPVRTVEHELQELAVMAALQSWLDRWEPLLIHRALSTGASVDQVAAAAGATPAEVATRWQEWSSGQRQLWLAYPDMDRTAEHDQVAEKLSVATSQ